MKEKLYKKDVNRLNIDLINFLREQFNLRIRAASGQLQQTHLLKCVRRNIARTKTLLTAEVMRNDK